jgi:hypothetical protein
MSARTSDFLHIWQDMELRLFGSLQMNLFLMHLETAQCICGSEDPQ